MLYCAGAVDINIILLLASWQYGIENADVRNCKRTQ